MRSKMVTSIARASRILIRLALAAGSVASAGQPYVTRFDGYVGYALLDSPHVGLLENGFALQLGVRPTTWLSAGFDYSRSTGDLTLTPGLLQPALQQQLAALLGPAAAATLVVPGHSLTQTFAVGPQLAYRRFERLTLFLRPVFAGAIRESTTVHPTDPITIAIASQLVPRGKKTDTAGFFGFGGGVDFILSRHVSIRVQADLVRDHLFSDLLKDARFSGRFSLGPAFNFGRNIVK